MSKTIIKNYLILAASTIFMLSVCYIVFLYMEQLRHVRTIAKYGIAIITLGPIYLFYVSLKNIQYSKIDEGDIEKIIQSDFALYLRPFSADKFSNFFDSAITSLTSHEDLLNKCVKNTFDLVTIGIPGEEIQPGQALRIYATEQDWRFKILRLMKNSKLIIVHLGHTQSLKWEIGQLSEYGCLNKTLFFNPIFDYDYDADRTANVLDILPGHSWLELTNAMESCFFYYKNGDINSLNCYKPIYPKSSDTDKLYNFLIGDSINSFVNIFKSMTGKFPKFSFADFILLKFGSVTSLYSAEMSACAEAIGIKIAPNTAGVMFKAVAYPLFAMPFLSLLYLFFSLMLK